MKGVRCAHDESERNGAGRCRACNRKRMAAARCARDGRVEGLSRIGRVRPLGDHPTRPLSLDIVLERDRGAVEAEPRRARARVSVSGGFQTAEGGGSGRAWVICRCATCATGRMAFDDGTIGRRQDDERGNQHPVHYLRLPASDADPNGHRRALILGEPPRGISVRPPTRERAA